MNIKRIIDKNNKFVLYIILVIALILIAIKFLNSYYEKSEQKKANEIINNEKNETVQKDAEIDNYEKSIENDSIEKTMKSFVDYCNNNEIENAYKMLTDECKKSMFPTIDYFKNTYINEIYDVNRSYEMVKWSIDNNKTTYLIKLYGNLLANGGTQKNYTEDYYTFVETEDGIYKLNINNYIYGEEKKIEQTKNGVTIQINYVDIFEDHEKMKITIKNISSKNICLTGNKYNKNIYLENSKGTTYSSINSELDKKEIILKPNETKIFNVEFNKVYSSTNKAQYLILSDIILDYDDYLNSTDKENYSYRTSIKVNYQK